MRYLAWCALPFSAAVFLACKLSWWWLCWPLAALFLVLLVPFALREGRQRVRLSLAAAGLCLGFLWFGLFTAVVVLPARHLHEKLSGFTGVVESYPQDYTGGMAVTVRMESGLAEGRRVWVWLEDDYLWLEPGDRLTGTAEFSAPVLEKDGYRYTSEGSFLTATAEVTEAYAANFMPLRCLPARLGQRLKETIAGLFPGEEGGLLQGLLIGDKSKLDSGLYSAFRRTGMAHLLAVSGLHVSFLTGIIYLLPGQRRRRIWIALPVLAGFALLTGGSPSVWRAVVMAALLLAAPLVYRETDPVTSLAVALLLLLLKNPYASESVSLQLSFAAVAGLACFHTKLYHWMVKPLRKQKKRRRFRRLLVRLWQMAAASLAMSLSAMVFSLPLAAVYFGTVSLVGPLTNLLCIWAASLTFALGLSACLAAWFCPMLGQLLAVPVQWLLRWLIGVARLLSRGAFVALRLDNLYYVGWFVVLLLLILLVIAIKPLRRRPLLPIACAVGLLFLALNLRMSSLNRPSFCATALDVGQGACTVFHSEGSFAAVDCGGEEAGDRLADYLQSAGADKLDLLVLTHYDSDHVNGVELLLQRLAVDTVALPEVEDGTGSREKLLKLLEINDCEAFFINGMTEVSLGEAQLKIFPPVSLEGDNASCLSVLASWQEHYTLVTGDLGQAQEKLLLEREELPDLDILVVGHHGSADAASAQLLADLNPDCALISVGENHYHLPSSETLERLLSYRCTVYRTDRNGNITIRYH